MLNVKSLCLPHAPMGLVDFEQLHHGEHLLRSSTIIQMIQTVVLLVVELKAEYC